MSEENFESQQSMAIVADETSAVGGADAKKNARKHKANVTRPVSARMKLLPVYKVTKGKKWNNKVIFRRRHKFAIGRASVGTCVKRPRIARGMQQIRNDNLEALAPLLRLGNETKFTFARGAIDETVRAADLFLHERHRDMKKLVTNKYGDVRRVSEYDARQAWDIATGGRHLADIAFTAKEGEKPVHKKTEKKRGKKRAAADASE